MRDQRITELARILVQHSTQVKPGENVYIEAFDLPDMQLVERLVEHVSDAGAHPFVNLRRNVITRSIILNGSESAFELASDSEADFMSKMHAYIGVRGASNTEEMCDIPSAQMKKYQEIWWHKVHLKVRVPKTKWAVLRYPTPSMAQAAQMSTTAFEDFYFKVCTCDYAGMEAAQKPLHELFTRTNKIRIVAPGTDLSFTKGDIPVVPCFGRRNIPDGEMFTAPVKDSINGTISYNTASRYQGIIFNQIKFEFRDGKIVHAEAGANTDRINEILDSDEGARYIGEFSLGLNHEVKKPMLDTLFDEKIGGSLHLTPGNAYDSADNGNKSQIHWDLVLIQTPEFGGGEVWFDDVLIRKDGIFLLPELNGLNPV